MPKDNESTKWLYEQLKSKGYNVGKDQAEFDNLMRNNKASREWAYKTATSAGMNVGKDQAEFDNLVAPRQQTSVPRKEPANGTQKSTEETVWKPTMKEKLAMNARLNAIGRSAQRTMDDFNTHIDNLNEYGKTLGDGHTVNSGYRFNPGSKKMERTYLTPTGERTFNKAAADAVSREYRDAVDMTVGGQIRRAQNRLQELKDKAAARLQELHDKWKQDYENNDAPLAAVLAADTYVPNIQSDQTYRALQAAIRQTEEQIKTLGEQQDRDNGVDVGFWRGFGRVAGDIRTWDFGIGDMMDAMTMMNAAEPKRPQTEQEKAANQEMMRAIHENQQTEAMYGGNASFWNRAGMMTGYMPSFMLDFAMTGGGFDAINVATKTAGKAATKALGKEAVEQMARQGFKTYVKNNGLRGLGQEAANWTIKALGTTADELLIRAPLMTNTVQGMDTAADIIDRKLGDVTIDENGNYNFTNDKTWGSAIWQGEANSIVENYSEMFGAHLPEVASVKNLGRLANVIGAKRLGGVLAKADAGALGGITDGTRRIFQQMGVSDYLGEVSEEYYGQLWRTMLNLDDAYRQNPDGTRTNLFATGQFHGDIWGGMALSMGLMGAGKTTMSAANYLSMKHDVNKADARASELLTPEVWEPLRSTIDMATNDNVGDVAEVIVNDRDMTDEEKAAVMNYMERSLYLRGVNLAELVKSRGGEQDENAQRANDSYMDGYNAQSDVEMQDARSMYELQRQKAEQSLTPEELDGIDNDPIGALRNLGDDEAINQTVIDYINAKQVYDGMLQRVRDDIDGRIDQSNTMIDSRTNRKTGMIQGATLKVQDDEGNDRRVYVLDGNLATYEDGTGIDKEKSDGSIIIRDAETGAVEMVSPDAIFSVEQPVDPETEKQTAAEAIRQQFAQEAANRIDGTVAFQPGDTYTVTDESGQAAQIQIVPNADGLVDNGDGTVNVSSDGGQTVVPMRKEDIQAMVDATNRARVAQIEQQREAMQQPQVQEQPTYSLNDEVTLLDENGNEVRGSITADVNEDGQYEVYTENPINGRKVNLFTAEELDRLQANPAENSRQNGGISTENGGNPAENSRHENVAIVNQEAVNNATVDDLMKTNRGYVEGYYNEHPEKVAEALAAPAQATADYINGKLTDRDYLIALNYSTGENSWLDGSATEEEIEREAAMNREKYLPYVSMPQVRQEQPAQQPVQSEQPVQSAIERIPKDEKGQPIYEQADPDTAWDAIVEQTEGDEAMAQNVADSMVADKEAELKKVEKSKPKGGTTIAEKIAAERERKNAVEQAKANLALWQKIAQTSQRRRQAALAEQSRQAEEAARLRREQEEKERAEREEAERIRREALNGVPDIIDDTPQDARARGYRRVNGEKIDRQTPLATRQGKEVQVKFDDKNIPTGHVALIEAGQLQPSHINGRRNPFHFIDEAQPKERNDEASVMSARKIAANIRPEEITSSVTAYTGAPTVNTRGEVIQGNNRSAALREMWAGQPEQAAVYKQYLTEHAADFGLAPEDVEAMQQPVLVNMVDVPDDEAISLGQFVAQDTESGGTERIKPKNIVQKMGDDMKGFAGRLLASPDEEMTFSELVDRNGMDVLKWMQAKNYITPTQYRSAFDSKGNLTGEAKNDLKGIMYQSIFQNGNTHLEEMFGALPAKAQKAILATAYRDYDSPNSERMNAELQASINAYYALSQMPDFANAKNYKEARKAAEAWKRQLSFDDVTGESYLPSERYSNFALLLATMYKGQTQVFIQNTLKNIFDLVQGTKEATLFEEPNNTPRTLVEAVNETMNGLSDELLLNENFIYNGQRRNNVLAGGSAAGQQGRQGSTRDDPSGGRTEGGTGIAADNRGTEGGVGQEEVERREAELASRVQVNDDDWQEGNGESPTYKRSIIIDGTHTATQIDEPDENGHYTGSYFEFDNKRFGDIAEIVDYIDNGNTLALKIAQAEAETDQNPTEAQKEAGNYKKGHVRIGQFNITVENPKGSVRRGTDANGNPWETTMQNTYGYIRGTEGVDGDHIDVFLTDDIDGWNGRRVYVVDQYNEDGTFDEHKVMLGFNDEDDARNAYLSNYSEDWANNRKIVITSTNLEDFEKWINSSHRKTKPFAEYKSVPAGETKAISPADRIAEIDEKMTDLKKQDESKIADLFSAQEENVVENQENSPFKKGDAVVYKGKPATVYDIEDNGRLVLDTGLTPVLYESADPKEVKPANTATHNAENTEINRIFANAVKTDMLAALDSGTKPYRSILDLRKRAAALGMEVDNDGRTDILLQELVEDGLVRAAREVVEQHGRDSRESYDLICKLYEMQPTIAARSSNRIKMQQYSTPLPMAWNATRFAMIGKKDGKVLEPTAGNGMLVFAVPANQVYVNELDETRLDNLREQGFAQVTQQDATEPFEGGQQYDVIIANPPFGKRDEVEYDGKMIPGLDPQITLNALASMKDNGKAAIIIGGNMEYGNNGGLKSMKPFFTYLYDHYNVKGVVDMDGKLYSKQGTTFPTRMILIAGRRSNEERAQTAVYPPIESKAIRKADSFDDLYDIIDEVINSKEKTNGTEILRSQQGQLVSVADQPSRNTDGTGHSGQSRKNDDTGHGQRGTAHSTESNSGRSQQVLSREHRTDTGNGETRRGAGGNTEGGSRGVSEPDVQRVGTVGVSTERVGLGETRTEQPKKRTLTEEKSAYRPHNSAFSLQSVAPAAMVEAMDNVLSQIEAENGNIDEFVRKELGYDTIEETHQALAAEQVDSVAMAIYQMKKGQALIIGDQTGVGKGRQMAALIRWAVKRGEKPIFITQKADLFSDIYRDLVDIGSGDLVPFIFNSDGAMVDSNGNTVHKPLSSKEMAKVFAAGQLPDEYDFAVLTYSQVNTGDEVSQKEAEEAAKKRGGRTKKSKASKDGKATPKATFLRAIAEDNYLFLDESHTAAGTSNTGAYLQSILRSAKAATFASATFAKRPDTMPLYAIRTAMSQAKVEPDKLIGIIEKGGVTLQEIMSRELTNAGQMVRRERDMSDVVTDWKTINDPATVKRARENYDRTIAAFNAIIKFQEDYVKPMVDAMDKELAVMAESAGIKRGTDKMGVENVPFASKTYNYTKQLMLALKVDAIANEVDAEIKAGRHPVIALESTMESSIKDYSAGEIISEPTFSASLLRGLDTVMQYTIKDENGKEQHARYTPKQLGEAGEKAYYELQDFIRKSTSDIFISPLDAIIERLHGMGYKVGELTGRNMYVERDDDGRVVVRRRTDKDKKRMQREFNSGELDVLILNKSASTGISLHASEKFSDQRQRTMIIAQPLSDINDYMQMIGRIDRTGQVHRGYYVNLGLPVPAENRFLMMLSTKLKSLNANTTTSQDSESNDVEAPDLLNKYGSQVVVEYLRDNPEIYEKMGGPLKKAGQGGGRVQTNELDEYKPQEDDARKITGYVALLTTKEQEEFYDDVVRRYNELIKYLNDTGNNDLKITVMPLRAKTLNKRVSSEGIDPTGTNPFARNSYVEQVEMDVLRKPMKAAEIRKTIEQVNKGKRPEDYIHQVIATIEKEDEVRIAAEEARYERSKAKAQEDIAKQTEKINRQQKRTAEEKQAAIADYVRETNENVETKHNDNIVRLNTNSDMLKQRLHMFEVGKSYLMPDNLESMAFDFSTPAIFCGYKAKDSKITASTTLAVFATLDGRRRMEIKLSQPEALRSIYKTTNDNWDAARSTTLENWDSQIPTGTRKTGFIMTGNILQAIADTQDEHGGYPGQLISYTDIDGNVHDGILMPDKWNTSMLKTSGAPIISRLKQIKDYMPVTSHDGKVDITGSSWAKVYYLTVPKTKKDGAIYYENKALLRAVNGSNFYPYRGKLRADIPEGNIEKVVMELSKLGVKVKEETNEDDALYRLDDYTTNEEEANDLFRVVDDASEITRLNSEPTVKVYRAMSLVDGKLYPPMSKKIGTGSNRISQAPSEFGQWEVSDERPELVEKEGTHKNHIYIVKDNGKGLWVAYNPYFHTSRNPLNDQFAEAYQRPNLVTVEVEVPESELTSGYQAEGAKDPVGETKWNAGPVNRQLSGDKKRKVILSRWMRPVRIVPDSEVAQRIAELIEGENVAIPDNTVTPSLLEELKKLGVKIVDGISKGRKKATAMMRGGNGALTDNELSYENDPVAKITGRSTRTAAQRRAFAERERQRMVNAVQKLAETLHLDNVDIVTDASTLQGKRAKAKGFYSRGTGRITIVIPNHTSVYDVEQTLLHEAVAHYGLRQLFGEHFDTFLDNVFQNADKDVRRRITELARERNWDFRTATEEYLASLAENTNFENTDASWWQKIKELFLRMLHKIGFENFSGVTLSDNELRYILWRSYENLAEPGRYRSILGEAEDVAKQNELKVGNYAVTDNTTRNVAEGRDELYRDGDPEVHERTLARDRYEQRVKRGVYQTQEALQDSMLGLREAMEAILKGEGKKEIRIEDVDGFENAYLGENRLSSVNKAEADAFAHTLFKPLLDEVAKLAPTKEAREELTDYMMAKHGLERNRVMRQREKDKLIDASELSKDKPQPPTENDDDYDLKMDAYNKAVEDWNNQVEAELGDKFEAINQRDFAGLTALTDTDNVADAEAEARIMVEDYESGHNTDTLWERTNAVSDATLYKLYESGMMSKETYDNIRSMYDYYIPLRGFDEKTGEEAYAYLNSKNSAFNAPIKTAKGRKSKADDPFAYLQSMAESAIVQGNRNKLVKQKFLNFVLNHPSDLASVSDIWLKYDKVADEWQPVFPDNINADDTPSEVERKMQAFEYKMKELAEQAPDLYKHGKDTVNIPYRVVEKRDLRQHQVVVKRGGRDYVITINGNPRAAQALNGQTNPDNDMSGAVGAILKAGERINRELSALYTTRNPDFVVSNFIRDMLYSNSMMWIKESPNYALRFHRNFAKVNPVRMKMLLAKYRKNELDMSNDTERMFHQFMMNGGETGYSNMRDIEKHKNDIRREIRKANGRLPIRKAWDFLAERLDEVNRDVENCARFAAFMTSREMGRTIDRSIYDAKEISVNFNKKGSGAKFMGATGQTKLGNASAFMSGLGRSGFVFWNAAIQGTANFGRQAKRHPAKALTSVAAMFLLGAIVASLGYGDDDEDDKNSYWNLPEYVRRSNLLFRAGGQWISIPLPVEYRAVYGLGELMTSTLSGKEHFTDGELAGKIAGQVSQLLPLDFMEGGGGFKAFIPSSIKPFAEAYGYKKSWTGLPLYKDTPYNKDMPEWTKAYKSANKYLVDLSETLNEMSGGDQYTKGAVDFNPAQVEYVLNGYFGGIANTINRMTKMGETLIGQREYDPNSFLVLNRILKNGDERTEYKAVNNEYFRLKDEHDKLRTRLRNYERDTDNGVFDYAEKIDFLYNSPEYARYEIFENYRPDIDGLYDMLKEANTYGDKEAVKDIEAQLNELKKMMINDMNKTRK